MNVVRKTSGFISAGDLCFVGLLSLSILAVMVTFLCKEFVPWIWEWGLMRPIHILLLAIWWTLVPVTVGCWAKYAKAWVAFSNREISLRNAHAAGVDHVRLILDDVWKTVQQQAELTSRYETAFKDLYLGLAQQRYQGKSALAFIQEHNPTLPTQVYERLGRLIEQKRAELTSVQKSLIDLGQQHNDLRLTFPGSLFISEREALSLDLVTSGLTESAVEAGKEDDIRVFREQSKTK
ncbi:hypothetical protein ACFLSJ_04535 [Verrucomicrobiota bacterium]